MNICRGGALVNVALVAFVLWLSPALEASAEAPF